MAIYRGVGGSGDATVDATNTAALAIAAAASAVLSQNSATASATSASNSATASAASAVLAQNAVTTLGFNLSTNNNWGGINTFLTASVGTFQPIPINQADARYLGILANAVSATNVAYTGLTGTPTIWNQNTTGSAASLSVTLAVTSGGTGVTTSTGTGSTVLNTSPTLVAPNLGTPASGMVTNLTGTGSININGTVVGVVKNVATPIASPETPVAIGKPVALVNIPEVGVPKTGVTNVGLVLRTVEPVPVLVVTPVPPDVTANIALNVAALVAETALAEIPKYLASAWLIGIG